MGSIDPLRVFGNSTRLLGITAAQNTDFIGKQGCASCASQKLERIDNIGFFSFDKYIHLDMK